MNKVRPCIFCPNDALPDGELCSECKKREETLTVDLDEEAEDEND